MSERTNHLIERAAARLRNAKAVPISDGTTPTPAASEAAAADGAAPESARMDPPSTVGQPAVPGFKPFSVPAPGTAVIPPAILPRADARPSHSVPLAPTVIKPPSPPAEPVETIARQRGEVPDVVPGPLPDPPTLPRPSAIPGPPPPVSIGGGPSFGVTRPQPGPSANEPLGRARAPQTPIVQLDALERAGMVVARTTRTRISEEYRIAIGRILRTLHDTADIQGARNVMMVTSARPGEGKSFTALNLAGSIAQNGTEAVLLIDVDPKVKPLSDQLGLGDVQGFLDLVSDPSLRPEDMIRNTAMPNLSVMPVGTRLGGAAQTVGGIASTRPIIPTIARLARRFPKHLIILDAPPCLSTSDPHSLAPHVGQVVLVVEAERTQRTEVEAAIELVRVCPSITMLLNKVRMTTSHTFGAYDYFGSYT